MLCPKLVLLKYLMNEDVSQSEFARICKLSRKSIWSFLHGAEISAKAAQKIEDATDGKIKYEELTYKKRPRNYTERKSVKEKMLS